MSTSQQQTTVPGPGVPAAESRPVNLQLSTPETSRALGKEPRRALALLRATNLLGDATAARAILRFIGKDPSKDTVSSAHAVVISEADCEKLALKLKQKGYPLTDAGLRAFKLERGLSGEIRIGPEVAAALARFAAGRDVRVRVSPDDWQKLDLESQRAMKLLALMAETPSDLAAVARALGQPDPTDGETGQAALSRELAVRLVEWAHATCLEFSNEGLQRLATSLRWPAALIDARLARLVTDALLGRGEPVHDYSRLTCQGCTLNGRTVAMLTAALNNLEGLPLKVLKGSYETSDHKGAHPHMGGGAADLSVKGFQNNQIARFVVALRGAGFAAWYRPREDRPHVHAVAIGDREMAPAAQWQVRQYFQGKDGRSHMGPDPHGGPPGDLPAWMLKHRLVMP